jgi:putative DNA primase/helicase
MNEKAEDLAFGRWPEILQTAGMSDSFFNGRHGPCPFCGGADRYRWSNKNGGLWVCTFCTEGRYANGFKMLMAHMTYGNFRDAADHVRAYFNGSALDGRPRQALAPRRHEPEMDVERNLEKMIGIWDASHPITKGDPVDLYLKSRVPGLNFAPQMLRFHPAMDYWAPPDTPQGRPVLLGQYPAMVAKAFDPRGNFVQLHKTYLTSQGSKADVPVVKKTERGVGVNGFAVPMMAVAGDTLGVAEGIESALAAAMLRKIPVWPCLNGPSMAAYDVPDHLLDQVKRIVVFADHDELKPLAAAAGQAGRRYRSAGSHYAEQLSERVRARGKRVLVVKASRVGFDMADHWAALRPQEVSEA